MSRVPYRHTKKWKKAKAEKKIDTHIWKTRNVEVLYIQYGNSYVLYIQRLRFGMQRRTAQFTFMLSLISCSYRNNDDINRHT